LVVKEAGTGQLSRGSAERRMTAFDRSLFVRMVGVTGILLVGTLGVVILTDEPGSTAPMRVARVAAFTPALSVAAALLCLEQARDRGELRALAALGFSPWRAARGATLAGWLLGAVAALLLVSAWADASSLFPVLPEPHGWRLAGTRWVEAARGVAVAPDGTLVLSSPTALRTTARTAHAWVSAVAIGAHALVGPPWAASPMSGAARLTGLFLSIALTVTLLHLFAAGLASAGWLVLGAAPLAVQAAYSRSVGSLRLSRRS
jgi:hypothetical protein